MTPAGDTTRPRGVDAAFDDKSNFTPHAGAILTEKVLRGVELWKTMNRCLPARPLGSGYSTVEALYPLVCALAVGGRGISAVETLKNHADDCRIFGLEAIPSAATVYNALCDVAGLKQRTLDEAYEPVEEKGLARMDLFGDVKKAPARRRLVPETPEWAPEENLKKIRDFEEAMARRCMRAQSQKIARTMGHWIVFADASDLEVEGTCFDAADLVYTGERALRWFSTMFGPTIVAEDVGPGSRDEGLTMPGVLERAGRTIKGEMGKGPVLTLMDSAYYEKQVVERLREMEWKFIVGANQQRPHLTRLAEDRPEGSWAATGPDPRRKWAESEVAVFNDHPGDWAFGVTIVARRWRAEGELPGTWNYSFVATDLGPEDLPKREIKRHGFAPLIWMLYGTKQGRENHYKTALRDLGLHHPPSGRLGINQAFYALATAMANVAMVIRYRVLKGEDRGMTWWRFRQTYMTLAGRVVETGHRVKVWLSGAGLSAKLKQAWLWAFEAAGEI
jgi:hypothetical protein